VNVGNGSEGIDVMVGVSDSRGPREGVAAVNVPDGVAVKNVPL
jgi:hypothetical protein